MGITTDEFEKFEEKLKQEQIDDAELLRVAYYDEIEADAVKKYTRAT